MVNSGEQSEKQTEHLGQKRSKDLCTNATNVRPIAAYQLAL